MINSSFFKYEPSKIKIYPINPEVPGSAIFAIKKKENIIEKMIQNRNILIYLVNLFTRFRYFISPIVMLTKIEGDGSYDLPLF